MAPIQLHGGPTPNARKVAIALYEMELAWELVPVDILAGDQLTPEFLALNPNNKTPVIVDADGPGGRRLVLCESGAILLYLADKAGRFVPGDAVARAICWQWLMFQMSGIGPMFGQDAHFSYYAADKHPYAIARYAREVSRLLGVLNQRLGEAKWLAGDEYTIADMAMLPYCQRRLLQSADLYPNAARWAAAMAERPAVRAGMAVGIARPETIEGGMAGLTEGQQSILWGDRQHAPR